MKNTPVPKRRPQRKVQSSELAYERAKGFLQRRIENLDSLNNKLTTILAFSGVALNLVGLLPFPTYGTVDPEKLLYMNYPYSKLKEEDLKLYIARQWVKAAHQLDKQIWGKAILLRSAIFLAVTATVLAAYCYAIVPSQCKQTSTIGSIGIEELRIPVRHYVVWRTRVQLTA